MKNSHCVQRGLWAATAAFFTASLLPANSLHHWLGHRPLEVGTRTGGNNIYHEFESAVPQHRTRHTGLGNRRCQRVLYLQPGNLYSTEYASRAPTVTLPPALASTSPPMPPGRTSLNSIMVQHSQSMLLLSM